MNVPLRTRPAVRGSTVAVRPAAADGRAAPRTDYRRATGGWLVGIGLLQAVLALRPGLNDNPFQDEGLYLYMGHRMIDHLAHGVVLTENPGSFFSGSPGLYPVIAAVADHVGGLYAARLLSLAFAVLAMVATFGIGRQLFGRLAGLLGALAFALSGSVIFQSHLATYDAMAMSLFAVAAWLAVVSATRDQLLWAPIVALVLVAAFLTKYAAAVYAPGVGLLAVAVAWRTDHRWTVLVRAATMVLTAAVVAVFIIMTWGNAIVPGIVSTTLDRDVLAPAASSDLALSVLRWTGPWLALGVAGALTARRTWPVSVVLLGLSVAGPAQQIVIGESTSLAKHVAFGMVFLSPLVGNLLACGVRRLRWTGSLIAVVAMVGLLVAGWQSSADFLTGWVDDRALLPILEADIAAAPGKAILGEEPSAQRYRLASITTPEMWADTFVFYYDGLQGAPAYRRAIDQSHFGTIFLNLNTPNGRLINEYLTTSDTPYRLSAQPSVTIAGDDVGVWLVWTPKVLATG